MNLKQIRRVLKNVIVVIWGICALVWVFTLERVNMNAPRTPDTSAGRVYPFVNHGTKVFMNFEEYVCLTAIPVVVAILIPILFLLDPSMFNRKKRRSVGDDGDDSERDDEN